jgi:hypothetical protein
LFGQGWWTRVADRINPAAPIYGYWSSLGNAVSLLRRDKNARTLRERIPAANGTHQTSISKQILTARIGGLVSHDAVVESGPLANKRFDLLGTEKAGGRDALSRRS